MKVSIAIVAAVTLVLCACAPLQQQPGSGDPGSDTRETPEGKTAKAPEPETREDSERPPPSEPAEPEPPEPTSDQADSAAPPTEPDVAAEESDDAEATARPSTPATRAEENAKPAPEAAGEDSAKDAAPGRQPPVDLEGQIRLLGGDADVNEAVVYFVAQSSGNGATDISDSGPAEIVTRDKLLSPTVLTVSKGTEVRFPNEDPILHNLFSVSSNNEFDLGVYGPGESPSVRFEHPGAVNIYCNVHQNMHAHVLVIDTPWHTRADADGRFSLTGLPAGEGELRIWHRQSEAWSRSIKLPVDEPIEVSLEVTKPRLPPHRDKTGQSYSRRDRDPYR